MTRSRIAHLALALALTALAAGPAAAQQLSAGVRGGVSFADFDGEDVLADGRRARAGANVGGFLVWRLNEWLALQPEALFTQKGTSLRDSEGTFDWTISYLEAPVLARGSLPLLEGRLVPHLLAGPALAIRAGCEAGLRSGGARFAVPCDSPAWEEPIEMNRLDIAAMAGAGVDLAVTGGWVTLDARYAFGLTSIDGSAFDNDIRNRALSVNLGFSMPLPR